MASALGTLLAELRLRVGLLGPPSTQQTTEAHLPPASTSATQSARGFVVAGRGPLSIKVRSTTARGLLWGSILAIRAIQLLKRTYQGLRV